MQSEDSGYSSWKEAVILTELNGSLLEKKMLYRMTASRLYDENIGEYQSYGIEICSETGDIVSLPDLTPNREAAAMFVRLCAQGDVAPEQLMEVAEDFLGKLYGSE